MRAAWAGHQGPASCSTSACNRRAGAREFGARNTLVELLVAACALLSAAQTARSSS